MDCCITIKTSTQYSSGLPVCSNYRAHTIALCRCCLTPFPLKIQGYSVTPLKPAVASFKFIARFYVISNTTREHPALCHMTALSFMRVAISLSWAFNPKAEQDKLLLV